MAWFIGVIIAVVVGGVVGIGGAFALVQSQGGGSLPAQVPGSIVVYGTN